jgi:hypothetical protein
MSMKCVGLDVFLYSPTGLPQPPGKLAGFELTVISNRGTKVWPGECPKIHLTDVFRCRFRGDGPALTLLAELERAGFQWVHIEKLHEIGGKPMFSLAQGE